jgi:hypothetical protein
VIQYGLFVLQSERMSCPAVVQHCVYNNKAIESPVKSAKIDSEPVPIMVENGSKMPSRALHLSNKERLLLRKQALKMKKRPVLAVGNLLSHLWLHFPSLLIMLLVIATIAFSNFIWGLVVHRYRLSCILIQFFVHSEFIIFGINFKFYMKLGQQNGDVPSIPKFSCLIKQKRSVNTSNVFPLFWVL